MELETVRTRSTRSRYESVYGNSSNGGPSTPAIALSPNVCQLPISRRLGAPPSDRTFASGERREIVCSMTTAWGFLRRSRFVSMRLCIRPCRSVTRPQRPASWPRVRNRRANAHAGSNPASIGDRTTSFACCRSNAKGRCRSHRAPKHTVTQCRPQVVAPMCGCRFTAQLGP